jgi:hypothetical protein
MSRIIRQRFRSHSDNPKSAIQNRKWVGIFAIFLALAVCAARAEAAAEENDVETAFRDDDTAECVG